MITRNHQTTQSSVLLFDADDTLWYDSIYFRRLSEQVGRILVETGAPEAKVKSELKTLSSESEPGEIGWVGTMIKLGQRFNLNQELSNRISTACEMFRSHPIELLPGVLETLSRLNAIRKFIYTKGVAEEQLEKLSRCGIAEMFEGHRIVRRKTPKTLLDFLQELSVGPQNSILIGNSLKNDIFPALEVGAFCIWFNHLQNFHSGGQECPKNVVEISTFPEIPSVLTKYRTLPKEVDGSIPLR